MVVQLFIDPVSQPARALMLFTRVNKIETEEKTISLFKGEHKTPEYAKVNPVQKIPAIVHNDFALSESVAILRYLARTFPVDDHWYPKDSKDQARVDEYLEWQHLGLRMPVTRFILTLIMPQRFGYEGPVPAKDLERVKADAVAALDNFETVWLGDKNFVRGDKLTIADMLAVGEVEMLQLVGAALNPREGRPKIAKYLDRVRDTVGADVYDEVHTGLKQAAERFQAMLAAKA